MQSEQSRCSAMHWPIDTGTDEQGASIPPRTDAKSLCSRALKPASAKSESTAPASKGGGAAARAVVVGVAVATVAAAVAAGISVAAEGSGARSFEQAASG